MTEPLIEPEIHITQETLDKIKNKYGSDEKTIMDYLYSMCLGVMSGWWQTFDERGPIPFPDIVNLNDNTVLRRSHTGIYNILHTLEPNENTMAHVLSKIGVFDSVSEAKKNGWNKPIKFGEYIFKKGTKRLFIGTLTRYEDDLPE